eukprot:1323069-Prymnesium_polylepis.1
MCSGPHRATIRREKRAQRARGEDRGARQTSNRHAFGPGVVRSITFVGPLARAPPCAAPSMRPSVAGRQGERGPTQNLGNLREVTRKGKGGKTRFFAGLATHTHS